MRALTFFLGILLAAPLASAEALGTSAPGSAPVDETQPAPAQVPAEAPEQAPVDVPVVTLTTATATAATSAVLGAVFALTPAVKLASTGAVAISANDPFDGSDDADPVTAVVATETTSATASDASASDASDEETIAAAPQVETTPAKVALPSKVPSEQELRVQYQHVGRDLLKLEEQRGKFDCGGLVPRFKAIKLDQALASAASRMQLYVDLVDMALKIDRFRGIHIAAECLQNPLASGCM